MKLKLLSILLFCSLSYLQAEDRAVRISKTMKTEQRIAMIIGNNNYQGVLSKLRNPINDARAIKGILEARGFEVIYKEDSGKREMKEALKKFYKKIKKGGVGFFYFSGHGLEIDGQNYLIPIDAKIEEKSDTEYEAIALGKITKRMQDAKNRLNIVVLDACRNDPFSRSVGTGGLAKSEPIGLFVSYSTGAGSVASDGKDGENGLFTKSLVKYMKKPLNLQTVFQKTREEVYDASHQKQFPAIYNQTIRGDFFFTLPKKGSPQEEKYTNELPKKVQYNSSSQSKSFDTDNSKKSFESSMDDDFENFMKEMN